MVKFMQILKDELQLMADQIVSISIHDSAVHDGDLEAVVFYRTESAVDNSEPIESLNYTPYVRDEDVAWNTILQEVVMNVNQPGK